MKFDLLYEPSILNVKPPKSTGREQFGEAFVTELLNRFEKHSREIYWQLSQCFTASSIVHHYQEFIFPYYEIDEVILGGGGSYNRTLVEMIRFGLKGRKMQNIYSRRFRLFLSGERSNRLLILANETYHRNPSNVPSATGAKAICSFREYNIPSNLKK